ncbi:cytochrome P450 [Periconia macrospinosa]|uniref:Cytochrome P450 n=1 Tax=Periconia macrospinosa TaxID=97972 RepID=A0A2V1DRB0_9PLEO|nr:cytochrome P450 [Periconia macrospinosa]
MTTMSNILEMDKSNLRAAMLLVVVALIPAIGVIIRQWHNRCKNRLPLPPSPPKASIISGHLPDVMRAAKEFRQHLLFDKWAKKYGEVYYVQIGPFRDYFINSDRAVRAIFDQASAQTAERPRWIVSSEQTANGMNLLLLSASNQTWKHQRKVTAVGLTSTQQAGAGLPFLHFETLKFINEIASDLAKGAKSQAIFQNIGRYTYSTFASQTFGLDIPTSDNPAIAYIHDTGTAQILGMLPGQWMVDIFPFLEKLPLIFKKWERDAKARHRRDYKWQNQSRMSTWAFLEAMLMFPEVCKKAQTFLDEVVGERVPVYDDIEKVPYIRCLMKEVWRWRPPVALGHPHVTTREIVYENYRIPKGARLHVNTWAIHHDPTRYEDLHRFMPEGYEGDTSTSGQSQQSAVSAGVSKRDHFAFGAGRRICKLAFPSTLRNSRITKSTSRPRIS